MRNSAGALAISAWLAAQAYGASCAANARFTTLNPAAEFGLTPPPGVTRIRGRELLTAARATKGVSPGEFLTDGCVEGGRRPLTEEQLQPVLDAAFGSAIHILAFSHYRIPAGDIEFKRADLAADGLWRGRILYGANYSTPVWAKIQFGTAKNRTHAVEHGDRVSVEVTSGTARVTFETVAESAGGAGEWILIHNPGNGHIFQAQVLEPGKVFIHK